MNRLALVATIGAVLVAAILGLIYAVSKQDVEDTPEPTAQSQPATPPAATTPPAAAQNGATQAPTQNTAATQSGAANGTQSGQASAGGSTGSQPQTNPPPAGQGQTAGGQPSTGSEPSGSQPQQSASAPAAQPAGNQSTGSQPATASGQSAAQTSSPAAQPANTQPANAQVAATTPPAPPPPKPSFDVVRVNPNGDAVVAGRAAPGAKVVLLDNGKPIGSAEADDRGEWVLLPDSAVDPGQHKFSLEADAGNGKKLDSEKEVIVVVPKPAEDIAGQPVNKPSGALAIEVPKQGEAPTQLLNSPGAPPSPAVGGAPAPEPVSTTGNASAGGTATPPPPPLSLDTIDYTQDGRAMLSGHTLPDSDLIIYLDNASLGAAKADDSGRWTFVPDTKAPTGDHQLRVDLVDGSGKVLARVKVPFSQPDFSAVKLTSDTVIVQPGNSLWRIARRTYGHGIQYTVIYEANKDHIADPDLIYPGQIFTLPKKSSE